MYYICRVKQLILEDMNNKEREIQFKKAMEGQDVFNVMSVDNINHRPHPYMIGPKHIAYANDHHFGILDEDTCKHVRCAHPKCELSYDEHTSDRVCFLQLKRNATEEEGRAILKSVSDTLGNTIVDGFAFLETPEKYRLS